MKIWKQTKTLDGLIDNLMISRIKDEANVVLTGGKSVNLDDFPNLRGIFRCGVTRTGLPFEEANKRSILIGFPSEKTSEYIYEETANFTSHIIMRMLYNNIGSIDPWIKLPRISLSDKNLLVIGMGRIGSKVFEKMKKFMNVDFYDIKEHSYNILYEKIKIADCITLHINNTLENEKFFDKKKLRLMKDGSVLVNTARGKIVSENDLYEELMEGRLYAAFDVFWEEPYSGKLKEFYPDRFYMTPHTASTCNEFIQGTAKDFHKFLNILGEDKND